MGESKVRVMNGLRVRLPGDAHRRAAAVETVDARMKLLAARRAAPTSHEVPVAAAPAPASSSAAEPNPTARSGDMGAVANAVDDVVLPSVSKATDGTWVLLRPRGPGLSTATVRVRRGFRSSGSVTASGSRASKLPSVDAAVYYIETRSDRARFSKRGSGVPGVSRDLTEHLAEAAGAKKKGPMATVYDALNAKQVLRSYRVSLPIDTPSDVVAVKIKFDPEVEAQLRDALSRQHGDAPQV
ncbi:MAG: hypothetical protein HHJ13_00220 [Phycicoccus sp.]|nr:hypothetical protein [Phycicoccus sp.]